MMIKENEYVHVTFWVVHQKLHDFGQYLLLTPLSRFSLQSIFVTKYLTLSLLYLNVYMDEQLK